MYAIKPVGGRRLRAADPPHRYLADHHGKYTRVRC